MTFSVDIEPIGRRIEAEEHQTILEAARTIPISEARSLSAPCGGKGLCGRCKVRIADGPVSPPSQAETATLSSEELRSGLRLACQAVILGSLRIEVPAQSLAGRQVLQMEGVEVDVAVDPAVKRHELRIRPSTISDPRSVWQQAVGELESRFGIKNARIDLDLVRNELPVVSEEQTLTISVRGRRVVNVFHTYPAPRPLGLAVDLGTTKVAAFLVDLESGATVASDATMNPQIPYGEDVMSRIAYCTADRAHSERMALLLRECIRDLLHTLVAQIGADSRQVEEVVIVGNTAMHHIVLGLPVRQLAASPYVPAATVPMEVKARSLGLSMAPGAVVHFPPCIAGFVGGDHVAMILGSRIHSTDAPTLGIDIGTNTEIVLSMPSELICCSCASGPAFEGAHVRHGMRAVDGAISAVTWIPDEGRLSYRTIGDAPALGLCGSGVIDAVAELIRAGIINNHGILDRDHPDVRLDERDRNPEYVIVPKAESATGDDITLTQKDVVAVQLAKAAIRTGTELLLAAAGLTKDDLAAVVIAGAFGARINLESALSIGLLPNIPMDKFRNVGNAAGTGARLALISQPEREMAERIARFTRYLELTAVPEFSGMFARALRFSQ